MLAQATLTIAPSPLNVQVVLHTIDDPKMERMLSGYKFGKQALEKVSVTPQRALIPCNRAIIPTSAPPPPVLLLLRMITLDGRRSRRTI